VVVAISAGAGEGGRVMAKHVEPPGVPAPQGLQDPRTGDVSAVAACDCTTAAPPSIPQSCCPHCASIGPHQRDPGAGPHVARLVCGACGWFLRWLPKPRPVAQEVRG
jgi:hypothetical protein